MEHAKLVVKSREEGVNFARKEELRRRMMNIAVLNNIAVAVPKAKEGTTAEEQRTSYTTSAFLSDDEGEDEDDEGS